MDPMGMLQVEVTITFFSKGEVTNPLCTKTFVTSLF